MILVINGGGISLYFGRRQNLEISILKILAEVKKKKPLDQIL